MTHDISCLCNRQPRLAEARISDRRRVPRPDDSPERQSTDAALGQGLPANGRRLRKGLAVDRLRFTRCRHRDYERGCGRTRMVGPPETRPSPPRWSYRRPAGIPWGIRLRASTFSALATSNSVSRLEFRVPRSMAPRKCLSMPLRSANSSCVNLARLRASRIRAPISARKFAEEFGLILAIGRMMVAL